MTEPAGENRLAPEPSLKGSVATRWSFWMRLAGSIATGLLLALAFSPHEESPAAWMGLVPLLLVIRTTRPAAAAGWSWLSGWVFGLCSLAWLWKLKDTGGPVWLVGIGWILLAAYAALYTGVFGYALAWCFRRVGTMHRGGNLGLMAVATAVWVGLEYARGTLAGGFPWNALGVSQYRNLGIIQLAEWGGVPLISGVIVWFNMAITLTILRLSEGWKKRERAGWQSELTAGLAVLLGCWVCGMMRLTTVRQMMVDWPRIRVAAVQPNIPQLRKWDSDSDRMILDRLRSQTELATLVEPSLVVWPETTLPGLLTSDPELQDFVTALTATNRAVLVGSMEMDAASGDRRFYNTAFLVGAEGEPVQGYRKQHLVPFGEYVPFFRGARWQTLLEPLGFYTCWPGTGPGVMTVPGLEVRLAVLICFEDVFAYLGGRAVRAGAGLLVNLTNDAWFDGTAGARQHRSHGVFRAVENRVSLLRAANSGVTCAIDPTGAITDELSGADGDHAVEGFMTASLVIRPESLPLTHHARWGDHLPGLAGLAVTGGVFILVWGFWKREDWKARPEGAGETKGIV